MTIEKDSTQYFIKIQSKFWTAMRSEDKDYVAAYKKKEWKKAGASFASSIALLGYGGFAFLGDTISIGHMGSAPDYMMVEYWPMFLGASAGLFVYSAFKSANAFRTGNYLNYLNSKDLESKL